MASNVTIKRGILSLLMLLFVNHLYADVKEDLEKILNTKDLKAYRKYREKTNGSYTSWLNSGIHRDLTYFHKEIIHYYEKRVPDKSNPKVTSIYTYRVRMITTESKIISYDFSEKKNRKVNNEW